MDHLLQATSRTFALTIPLLHEPTRREVTVAYLLFRVADTLELIPMADRIVYVVDPDKTTRSVLRSVREQLDQMGASVLGMVVSNVKPGKQKRREETDEQDHQFQALD